MSKKSRSFRTLLRTPPRMSHRTLTLGLILAVLFLILSAPAEVQADTKAPSAEDPVARAAGGLWGMQFTFGGLATMTTTNQTVPNTGTLLVTQVGLRMVRSENVIIPFFFGFGTNVVDPPGDDNSAANIGLRLGAGLEYHFRIWRRISPFMGGYGVFDYGNPTGGDNWNINITLLPTLGVEYYWGDRVSFIAQYFFGIGFGYQATGDVPTGNGGTTSGRTSFGVETSSGGSLSICFYF